MTIKAKLPIQICMNGLTIMIGQLGLVWLTLSKTGRKYVSLFTCFLLVFLLFNTKQALIGQ